MQEILDSRGNPMYTEVLMMIKQRSLAKLILLSPLTLGLYPLIFWWTFVDDMNEICVCDGKASPHFLIVILLSVPTLGVYPLVWFYRQQTRLKNIAPFYGIPIKERGSSVVFYCFGGCLVSAIGGFLPMLAQLGYHQAMFSLKDATVFGIAGGVIFSLAGVVMILNGIGILIRSFNTIAAAYNHKNSL